MRVLTIAPLLLSFRVGAPLGPRSCASLFCSAGAPLRHNWGRRLGAAWLCSGAALVLLLRRWTPVARSGAACAPLGCRWGIARSPRGHRSGAARTPLARRCACDAHAPHRAAAALRRAWARLVAPLGCRRGAAGAPLAGAPLGCPAAGAPQSNASKRNGDEHVLAPLAPLAPAPPRPRGGSAPTSRGPSPTCGPPRGSPG